MSRMGLVAGVCALVFALPAARAAGEAAGRAARNEAAVRSLIAVWHERELDRVDELIAPAYVIRHDAGSPWDGRTLSREEYKRRVESYPGYRFEIVDMVADDSKVALSFRMHMPASAPSGSGEARSVRETTGMTMFYFDDQGRISGHWQVIAR